MKAPAVALLVLALGMLACAIEPQLPTDTPAPNALGETPNAPTPTPNALGETPNAPTPTPNALGILRDVYVRSAPGTWGDVLGVISPGIVDGTCDGNWCKILQGYVWRGCTSDNPNNLGCQKAE